MKIIEVRQITAHVVETDSKDFPTHTRYGQNSWTVTMGESDEQVYDCAELEAAFQAFIASNAKLNDSGPATGGN
jgi:hypothetical protein